MEDDLETVIRKKWEIIIGSDADIVVCNLTKLKGDIFNKCILDQTPTTNNHFRAWN